MWHKREKNEWDREQGQTLVEFSLVMLVLFLLLFGIIDFARVFFAYATMSQGVREAARFAVVHPEADGPIIARARDSMVVIGGTENVQVIFPDKAPDNSPCRLHLCRVQVVATSDFPIWTPVVPNFQIVARATMHIE